MKMASVRWIFKILLQIMKIQHSGLHTPSCYGSNLLQPPHCPRNSLSNYPPLPCQQVSSHPPAQVPSPASHSTIYIFLFRQFSFCSHTLYGEQEDGSSLRHPLLLFHAKETEEPPAPLTAETTALLSEVVGRKAEALSLLQVLSRVHTRNTTGLKDAS